jgi:hypothetical protein
VAASPPAWVLAPSDLTFLFEQCKGCFYRKLVLGRRRPSTPFPKIFSTIDRAMKDFYLGRRAEKLAVGAPAGVIGSPDRWVKSIPIPVLGSDRPVVFRGRLDAMVACDDQSVGVVDFKCTLPSDSHLPLFTRQLHAYAWALEQPASGRPLHVSALGLLCFSPNTFEANGSTGALVGELSWIDVPLEDEGFDAFLTEVVSLLEADPPTPAPDCHWCARADRAFILVA